MPKSPEIPLLILSTIEINDRNRPDFIRLQNLEKYKTDEYTAVTEFIPSGGFCEECGRRYDEDEFSYDIEACCPVCGELNHDEDGIVLNVEENMKCKFCKAILTVFVDDMDDTVTVRSERPLGE